MTYKAPDTWQELSKCSPFSEREKINFFVENKFLNLLLLATVFGTEIP